MANAKPKTQNKIVRPPKKQEKVNGNRGQLAKLNNWGENCVDNKVEPKDISLAQKQILVLMKTDEIARQADRENPETFYNCFHQYLAMCIENGVNVTNLNAYASCGLSKFNIDDWIMGTKRSKDPRYKEFAEYIRAKCAAFREMQMSDGSMNPVVGIWWQKIYERYTENVVVETKPTNALGEEKTNSEIAEKYKDMPTD